MDKFIDKPLSTKWSVPVPAPDLEPFKQGYKLLGRSIRSYSAKERIFSGFQALFKTLISFWRLPEKVKVKWKVCFQGKKAAVIYANPTIQNVANLNLLQKNPAFISIRTDNTKVDNQSNESKYQALKENILTRISCTKDINHIQSAKIFIDIKNSSLKGSVHHLVKFSRDYIIKKLDSSCFDQDFLSKKLDEIMNAAQSMLGNIDKFSFDYRVLLKDQNGRFHCAIGSSDVIGYDKNIDPNHMEEYCAFFLKKMDRKIEPQLNKDFDFKEEINKENQIDLIELNDIENQPESVDTTTTLEKNSINDQYTTVFYKEISEKLSEIKISTISDWNGLQFFIDHLEAKYKKLFGPIPGGAYNYTGIKIVVPNPTFFEENLDFQKEWMKKIILYLGSYSLRLSGNWGARFAVAQALFYIEKLMQREDKQEMIQEIKTELLSQDKAVKISQPYNQITPYLSFLSNMKEYSNSFPWKNEFLSLFENP